MDVMEEMATDLAMGPLGLQVESEYLSRDFAEFLRAAWHVVEPAVDLEWGPHLDAMCLHLEAIARSLDRPATEDLLRNIAITIPPGTTKSITIGVMFPAWVWTWRPSTKFLTGSNEDSLAIRDAVSSRRLIESDWYRERWGHVFELTTDQNEKKKFENNKRGVRTTTTVGSNVTGKKGDILILDDPNDALKVNSLAERKRVIEWWRQAFFSRVNSAKRGCRIVVGQRTHVDDLLGTIIASKRFEHLNLPEEFDPANKSRTKIGWEDWRTEPGQLLRPDRFGPDQIIEAKDPNTGMGLRGYEAQHNQSPRLSEGGMFKRHWFKVVKLAPPPTFARCRAWDNAASAKKEGVSKGPDYSAGVLGTRNADDIIYIEDVKRGHWPGNERNKIRDTVSDLDSRKYQKYEIVIEQEPTASGKEVAEQAVKMLAGYHVTIAKPSGQTGGKEVRAQPFADQLEAGFVLLVEGDWNQDFIDECCDFGEGCRNDDQVDAASMMITHITLHKKRRVLVI